MWQRAPMSPCVRTQTQTTPCHMGAPCHEEASQAVEWSCGISPHSLCLFSHSVFPTFPGSNKRGKKKTKNTTLLHFFFLKLFVMGALAFRFLRLSHCVVCYQDDLTDFSLRRCSEDNTQSRLQTLHLFPLVQTQATDVFSVRNQQHGHLKPSLRWLCPTGQEALTFHWDPREAGRLFIG